MNAARVVLLIIAGVVLFALGLWVGGTRGDVESTHDKKPAECLRGQCADFVNEQALALEIEGREGPESTAVMAAVENRNHPVVFPAAGAATDAGFLQMLARTGCHAVEGGTPPASLRSPQGISPANLEVQNDCADPVMISFIDFQDAEQNLPFLLPSATSTIKTYAGHINCLRVADVQRS